MRVYSIEVPNEGRGFQRRLKLFSSKEARTQYLSNTCLIGTEEIDEFDEAPVWFAFHLELDIESGSYEDTEEEAIENVLWSLRHECRLAEYEVSDEGL